MITAVEAQSLSKDCALDNLLEDAITQAASQGLLEVYVDFRNSDENLFEVRDYLYSLGFEVSLCDCRELLISWGN